MSKASILSIVQQFRDTYLTQENIENEHIFSMKNFQWTRIIFSNISFKLIILNNFSRIICLLFHAAVDSLF